MYAANHDKENSEMEQRLKDVLLKNQRMFARESPYLDALLVYVSALGMFPSASTHLGLRLGSSLPFSPLFSSRHAKASRKTRWTRF
jgi:hypothetical protein